MRSRAQGPFATLLLLIPLLAIPLLAVFGIPQFAPVVASPTNGVPATDPEREVGQSDRYTAEDLFAPYDERAGQPLIRVASDPFHSDAPEFRRGEWPSEPVARANPVAVHASASHRDDAVPLRREPRTGLSSVMGTQRSVTEPRQAVNRTQPDTATTAPSPGRTSEPPLTWQAAVARLNALEIHRFRLEPGLRPDEFIFICTYVPPGHPQIARRFEAEDREPLVAVEKVLKQVEAWRRGR